MAQPFWKTPRQFLIKLSVHLSYDPTLSLLGIIFKINENIHPHRDLHMNVYSSSIHNNQKVKITLNVCELTSGFLKVWYNTDTVAQSTYRTGKTLVIAFFTYG